MLYLAVDHVEHLPLVYLFASFIAVLPTLFIHISKQPLFVLSFKAFKVPSGQILLNPFIFLKLGTSYFQQDDVCLFVFLLLFLCIGIHVPCGMISSNTGYYQIPTNIMAFQLLSTVLWVQCQLEHLSIFLPIYAEGWCRGG